MRHYNKPVTNKGNRMKGFILAAEPGVDIPPELARHQIRIVPMHVSFDGIAKNDGAFKMHIRYKSLWHTLIE